MNVHPSNSTASDRLSLFEQGLSAYQEVWHIFGRRKGRIAVLVMLGLLVAAAFCAVSGPWYDANTQLLVIKKRLDTTPITGPDQARIQDDYLSTHMLLITSRKVIGLAITKANLQNLDQFKHGNGLRMRFTDVATRSAPPADGESTDHEKLVTQIINSLVVTRDTPKPGLSPSSEVLNLSFRGNVSGDCPKILNAIIASYQEFLKDTYRNTNAEMLELITQARMVCQKDLETKEAAYQAFLADTPPLKTQNSSTAHQDRLLKIDMKLAALRMRRAEIEAAIAMIDKLAQDGRNPTPTVMRITAALSAGPPGTPNPLTNQEPWTTKLRAGVSLEEEFVSLQLQHAKLLAVHAKEHPEVLSVSRQMDAVRNMILPISAGSEGGERTTSRDEDLGAIKVELLKQELEDLSMTEQALTKLFQSEQKGVSASYIHEIQDEAHRKGIERDRLLYESILHRLKETSSVKDFGGYNTQVIGPALDGELATRKYALVFGLSLFCGLFGGCSWAYLAEIAAKRSQSAIGAS